MSRSITLSTTAAERLEAYVDAVTISLQTLLGFLRRESDALRACASADVLERVADEKNAAVEQVAALYEMLRALLANECGEDTPLADMVLTLRKSRPSMAARVERLVELTRECQQANLDNGMLVSVGLRSAHRAAHMLRSSPAQPRTRGTYEPVDQTKTRTTDRHFAITASRAG